MQIGRQEEFFEHGIDVVTTSLILSCDFDLPSSQCLSRQVPGMSTGQ